MSDILILIRKATTLIMEGRLTERATRCFDAKGESGDYRVTICVGRDAGREPTCTCPAETTCSHILAAMHMIGEDE